MFLWQNPLKLRKTSPLYNQGARFFIAQMGFFRRLKNQPKLHGNGGAHESPIANPAGKRRTPRNETAKCIGKFRLYKRKPCTPPKSNIETKNDGFKKRCQLSKHMAIWGTYMFRFQGYNPQETNMAHLGKAGKSSTQKCGRSVGDILVPWRVFFQPSFLMRIIIHGCFLKWWYPQNTPKWSLLMGKPMVVGYHHLRKHPRVPWGL